jgi:HK97 family phage portal protein
MAKVEEANYEVITSPTDSTSIRIRALTKEEALARSNKGITFTTDGGMPLYPQVNLLSRNPEALKYGNEGYSRNSLVFNVITRRAQAVQQGKLKVEVKGDEKEFLPDSDLQKLFDRPNPYMHANVFWEVCSIFVDIGGTCFVQKVRDDYGVVEALYPYHTSQIQPIQGTDTWVTGYVYDNGAGFRKEIPKEDIIELKFPSVNLMFPYRTTSPLLSLLKEVDIDNQRGEFEVAMLLNGGVPSFAIYPGDDVAPMGQDQINTAMEAIIAKINGRNRGRPLLMNPNFKLEKLGNSPKEMSLEIYSEIPETRVCAVYGIPPGYAQTLVGLKVAGTYANRDTDKRSFYEDTVVAMWQRYGGAMNAGFENEFFYDGINGQDVDIAFDYSDVPALRESDDKKQARALDKWKANLIPRNKALTELGDEAIEGPEGDEYFKSSAPEPIAPEGLPIELPKEKP